MKNDESIAKNELIAKFMGCHITPAHEAAGGNIATRTNPSWDFPGENSGLKCHTRYLEYNQSWDWLMPVVSKASSEFHFEVDGRGGFDMEYMMGDEELGHHLRFGNLSHVYEIIIKFIKWYNEYKIDRGEEDE